MCGVDAADVATAHRLLAQHRTEVLVGHSGPAPDLRGVPGVRTVAPDGPARVRLTLDGFTVWRTGQVVGVPIGALTVSVTGFLTDNARFAALADGAGFTGLGSVDGFVAALFALLALPAGVFAAVRIGALADDETARRLGLLLAGPRRPARCSARTPR